MGNTHTDAFEFRRYSDLSGARQHASLVKHNGRPALSFDLRSIEDKAEPSEHFSDKEKFYINLTEVERRTFQRILTGWPLAAIARDENTSNAAVRARILGNSKGQGGMIAKNFWVLPWWQTRQQLRTYEITHRTSHRGRLEQACNAETNSANGRFPPGH